MQDLVFDNEEELKMDKRKNLLFDYPFKKNSIIEQVIEQAKTLEKSRMDFYKFIDELVFYQYLPKEINDFLIEDWKAKLIKNPFKDWRTEFGSNLVNIYVPDFPSNLIIKEKDGSCGFAKDRWIININRTIRNLKEYPFRFDDVIIEVIMAIPLKSCDIDNRYFKPILDGIVLSGILRDDSYKFIPKLILSMEYNSEEPHTTINIFGNLITDKKN